MFDEALVDTLVVACAFVFNLLLIVVFLARAMDREDLEVKTGYAVSILIIPFAVSWVLNLLWEREVGLLITGAPIIAFLTYDFWYRTVTGRKTRHHPSGRWPVGLYLYLALYLFGSMLLVGYVFLVSLNLGFVVLATFYCSLASFGYYPYMHRKERQGAMRSTG
jgi:hypothetical protein